MANPTTKTDICNLALSRIGAKTVTDAEIAADTAVKAQHCNRHYEQTRDALLRSFTWRFASTREELTENETSPDFEWDAAFDLPDDFMALKSVFADNATPGNLYLGSYAVEGSQILINESTCNIRYIKQVTTVTDFDPLFIEILVLSLSLKLVMPLSQDLKLYNEIKKEHKEVLRKVRAMDRQETNTVGRVDSRAWNDARRGGRIDSKLGSD